MNPFDPALLARSANRLQANITVTSDADIQRRNWILIDIDADNPSDTSSSEAEHETALTTVRRAYKMLLAEGFPDLGVSDSGNGGHIYIPVDLQRGDGGLVKRVLQAASLRFDRDVAKVDVSVHNPSRITKLTGTWARKGDSLPDRPHRQSRWLHLPDDFMPTPVNLLKAFAAYAPDPPVGTRPESRGFDVDQSIAEHSVPVRRGPEPWPGGGNGARRWQLAGCINGHQDQAPYLIQLPNGAVSAGCHHDSCQGWGWKEFRRHYQPDYNGSGGRETSSSGAPELQREKAFASTPRLKSR